MKLRFHQFKKGQYAIKYYPDLLCYSKIEDNNREKQISEDIEHDIWETRKPATFSKLFVNLTDNCNMQCVYCYRSPTKSQKKRATPNNIKKAIDLLVEQSDSELELTFVGGEPLLEWDTLSEMIEYAHKRCKKEKLNFNTGIITNGTLLDEEKIKFLSIYKARILMSIDGKSDRHDRHRQYLNGGGSFKNVTQHIDTLLNSDVKVEALAIMKRGETDIDEVVKELSEIGFINIGVNLISTHQVDKQYREKDLSSLDKAYGRLTDWLVANYDKRINFTPFNDIFTFMRQGVRRSYFCHAGTESISMDTNGIFYICPVLTDYQVGILGDVDIGLDKKAIDDFYENLIWNIEKNCWDCWANTICGGGCVSRKYAFTGSLFKNSTVECQHQKMKMEWAMVYGAMLKDKRGD